MNDEANERPEESSLADSNIENEMPDLSELPEPDLPGIDTTAIAVMDGVVVEDIQMGEDAAVEVLQNRCREQDFPFHYDNNCPVCRICLNDEALHRVYLANDRQAQSVTQYVCENYPDESISWNVINNHLHSHFLPAFDAPELKRRNMLESLKEAARIRFAMPPEDFLANIAEITAQTMEDLRVKQSDVNDLDSFVDIAKTMATLANATTKVVESKLKIEQDKAGAEDIEARVQQYVMAKLQFIIDRVSESARTEILEAADEMRRLSRNSG